MLVKNRVLCVGALSLVLLFSAASLAEEPKVIPSGAKVYIAPMDGFESYLKDAIEKKKVPLVVVDNKQDAEYEISGVSSSQKASVAKKVIFGSWHSREEASIQVTDLKSGVVAFAYSYNTSNSAHGKRSSAESCAKHLKEAIKPQ